MTEVKLVDQDGEPVPSTRFELELADGATVFFDEKKSARSAGVRAERIVISFRPSMKRSNACAPRFVHTPAIHVKEIKSSERLRGTGWVSHSMLIAPVVARTSRASFAFGWEEW